MSLSFEQIERLKTGTPVDVQHLDISTSAAYSVPLFPGILYKMEATDGILYKIVDDYVWGARFGTDYYENSPLRIWASDAEDAQLAASGYWRKSELVTSSQVTLDKTKVEISQDYVLEFQQDDQDDVIRAPLYARPVLRQGSWFWQQKEIAASKAMTVIVTHVDDDALELMQYQIQSYNGTSLRHWTGAAWQDAAAWVDITGSAVLATFLDDVNAETSLQAYNIALRPKDNYADGVSWIGDLGLCEKIAAGQGERMEQDKPRYITVSRPKRIAVICDADGKKLYINKYIP